MVHKKYLVILVLMIINYTRCEFNHSIHKRVSEINNRSRELYGDVRRGNVNKDFELEELMYPRGNKEKLSAISQEWREYYDCSAELVDAVTPTRIARSVIVMVFQGATARLPCEVCVEPDVMLQPTWLYAKNATMDYEEIREYDRLTLDEQNTITIYNAVPGDMGVYWCTVGDGGGGGLIFLEVTDNEPYTVVKPPESRGPYAVATEVYQGVILFTQWSPWSECSACDKVGRRHRYGVCYVKLSEDLISDYVKDPVVTTKLIKLFKLDNQTVELFQTFPAGLPCRSQYMPQAMKKLDVMRERPSEIMIGMCKVRCEETMNDDEANNATEGSADESGTLIYPITQRLPKQPPLPARDTIFVDFGQRIVIRCPGTTLRDVPIQWRVGTKVLVPRDVDKGSGGRVYLNPRDHLVFNIIVYRDGNLYSCWQRDNLAGTVSLVVRARARARGAGGLLLCALLAAVLLRAAHSARLTRQSALYHLY